MNIWWTPTMCSLQFWKRWWPRGFYTQDHSSNTRQLAQGHTAKRSWNCTCLSWLPEEAVAPYSSTPASKIPWTEEPGRLQSMGSLRVGHDWVTSLSLFTFMHWRRKWQPIPVFLPRESQGRGSLVGCRLWGRMELLSSSSPDFRTLFWPR